MKKEKTASVFFNRLFQALQPDYRGMNEELTLMQRSIFAPTQTQCVPDPLPLSVSEPQRTIHVIGDNAEPVQPAYCQ
ncbi:hypothetical protein [Treponema sp.]|uniref:hypothetical protein n=1 Tax=Treponema sp. TaxID=166 RepID=UPI003FA1D005